MVNRLIAPRSARIVRRGWTKPQNPLLDIHHPLARGLVGCWPLGEVSGGLGLYRDVGLHGADGIGTTTMGGSLPIDQYAHHGGTAIHIGLQSFIDVPTAVAGSAFDLPSGSLTMSFWVQPDSAGAGFSYFLTKIDPNNGYAVQWNDANNTQKPKLQIIKGGVENHVYADHALLAADPWTFIAATYDTNTGLGLIYWNGIQQSGSFSSPNSLGASSHNVQIGQWSGAATRYSGGIDCVRIYDRALSPDEIFQLFVEPYAALYDPEPFNLVGFHTPPLAFHMPLSFWTERGKINPGPFTGYTPQIPARVPFTGQRFDAQWFGERNPFAGLRGRVI